MSKPTYMKLLGELEESLSREKILFKTMKDIACDPSCMKHCEMAKEAIKKVVSVGNTVRE